jgi:hypothetical protein
MNTENNVFMNTVEKMPVSEEVKTVEKSSTESQTPSVNDTPITDENSALNAMVSYLNIAQKRGAFNLQESSKIWECIKIFMKPQSV